MVSAHRLAAYQKFGDLIYKDGIECRHVDGNKANFKPDNIILGSHAQNGEVSDGTINQNL